LALDGTDERNRRRLTDVQAAVDKFNFAAPALLDNAYLPWNFLDRSRRTHSRAPTATVTEFREDQRLGF
jgi:hypothetical protein